MLNYSKLESRAHAYLTLATLAPAGPGRAHEKARAWAEVECLYKERDGLSGPLLRLLAEEVEAHGDYIVGARNGHAVYNIESLARAIGSAQGALMVLRLVGARPTREGWSTQEYPGANTDAIPVHFEDGHFVTFFNDLAALFAPDEPTDE